VQVLPVNYKRSKQTHKVDSSHESVSVGILAESFGQNFKLSKDFALKVFFAIHNVIKNFHFWQKNSAGFSKH
jgi:hypothetical protein